MAFDFNRKTPQMIKFNGKPVSRLLYNNVEVWTSKLPYIELDYIESTGKQYIDTGIPCNGAYRWDITVRPTKASTANSWLMGCIEKVGSTYKRFHPSNSNSTNAKWWVGSTDTIYTTVPENGEFDITIGNRGGTNTEVIINGNSQTLSVSRSNQSELTFWLFGRNSNDNSLKSLGYYAIPKFKVVDADDNVIADYIPVIRKSDGVVCFYDKATRTYKENLGTGSLIPGTLKHLPQGYQACEYLQSDGNQWIDTGVYGNENTYAEIDFQYYETSSTVGHGKLFGARRASQSDSFVAGTGNGNIATSQQYFSQVDSGTIKDPSSKPYVNLNKTNIYLSADGMYIDGVLGREFEKITPFTTYVTLWLFGYYNSNTDTPTGAIKGKYRCFDFILREGDICNRFYFPMLDENGRPCMYDAINELPYYNQGEGEFTYKLRQPTDNLIIETQQGFPSGSNTSITTNQTYPFTYYFNDLYMEEGKTYKVKLHYVRTPQSTDDGTIRFRMLNEDGSFWGAPASGNYNDYFKNVELKDKVGASTISAWFSSTEYILTAKKNCKARILIIVGTKAKTPPCCYMVECKEVK